MAEKAHVKKRRALRLDCATVFIVAIAISLFTVVAAHVRQMLARPQALAGANVSLSGEYVVQDIQGFNNRGGFTRMPLDELSLSSVVTLQQGSDWLEFTYRRSLVLDHPVE